jgi:L-fuconolactonase
MKIDAHQHFWIYNEKDFGWITDDMALLHQDFMPDNSLKILLDNGFDACVAVQARQTETETEFLLDLAKKSDFIRGVVGWVDLQAENIEERLSYFSGFPKLSGIRHVVQAEPDTDFLLRPAFQNGISLLKQYNLVYDILIYPKQLKSAVKMVRQFSEQVFVLDHIAKPLIKGKVLEPWRSHIKELARSENVYCKVSGMVTEANWQNWQEKDFRVYLDVIVESFGTDRILYGSDYPVCLAAGNYKSQLQIIEHYLASFSASEQADILGNTACRVYRLI